MLISIALCTYNGARYLEEQLVSIAKQTRLPDEMIICDDQSKDNTLEIITNFASKVPFPIRLSPNEKNLGSTKNFEKAIGLCTGDLIFLSDQDDIWHPEKLDKIEKIFSTSDSIGAVFSDAEAVDENLKPLGYNLWESIGFDKKEQEHFNEGKSIEILLKHNVVTGATLAFRSEFRDLFLPINNLWVHDGWIALSIAFASNLVMIPEPLIKYRQHFMQQIGAEKPLSMFNKLNEKICQIRNLKSSFYDFQSEYEKSIAAHRLLVNSQFPSIKIDKIPLLNARIEHFYIRANLPLSRSRRIPVAAKQLFKMNYYHYSEGIASFLGDILRSNQKETENEQN